jgi:hypothetical protein
VKAELPRLVVQGNSDPTSASLHFAWNGATQIDAYDLYAGPTITSTAMITTVAATGFETSAVLNDLDPSTCAFQVHPVHHMGASTPFSNMAYLVDRPECLDKLPYHNYLQMVRQSSP